METPRLCPECHAPLLADAPVGLCPRCLLQQGALRDSASAPTEPPRRHKGPPSAPALAAVAARFPQFEVRQLIGVGGMGAVYEVRQPQLDRMVALKVMLPEVADDPKFAERFTREARALAKLNHPNIVAVYDFGQAGDWFYFVMEFVDGANLRQTMRAGRLTAAQALAIVPKLCDALQFAHDEGIMHRDIKPENILIDKKGRVKIADFGLAKLLGSEPDDHSITVTGVGMGTPRYMAPEQLDDAKNVDHRADIYSLGVVFYEMLTGELPMGRFATPSEKVQIDVRLDEIVLRSLERDVARRYQQVSEVKTAVENVTSSPRVAPAEPSAPSRAPAEPVSSVPPRIIFQRGVLCFIGLFALWFALANLLNGPVRPLVSMGTDYELISAFIALVVCAVIAFVLWPAISGRTRSRVTATPSELTERIKAAGLFLLIAGIAIALSGLVGFFLGAVQAIIDKAGAAAASPVPSGALQFLAITLCGVAVLAGGVAMRKLRFHGFALGMAIGLVALPPVMVLMTRQPPPQIILFQFAFGLYAGIRAFRLLRKPEVEAVFVNAASDSGTSANANANAEPRLSQLALWGAMGAALGFLIAAPAAFLHFKYHLPASWEFALLGLAVLCAVGAVFGTTISGAIAIAQIKRSGGKLYGLPVAFADAVFFPLLAVFVGLAWVVAKTIASLGNLSLPRTEMPGALVSLIVCGFIGRALWRWLNPATVAKDSATAAAPLDHRVSEALTIGLPGWFNRRAPWVQQLIQGALTLAVMAAMLVFLGFNLHAKTDVTAGQVTNSGAVQIGQPSPWLTVDFSSTHHGFAIHWFSASLWIGLIGVAAGCLSERLRRSRPGFDEMADRPKRRRWLVVMCVIGALYVVAVGFNAAVMSGATSKAARSAKVPPSASKAAPSQEFSIAQDRSQLPTARTPGRQDYAFTFAGPTNHTLNVWLEVWREGRLEIVDSFDFWARPKLGVPLVASLRLTTMDGEVASVESAGKVRFDWTMNCGGTNATGITAGAWRTNIFKNCFSLNSTWDYPPKDGWHPRSGETVTVLALCGYRPDNLSAYDQTWDETSLLKGWPNEAILLRARFNPARVGDLANGSGLGNNFTDRGNIRHTFAQFTIAKVIGVDLGRPENPAAAHKLLVAAVATPERQQAVKKMTFQLGAGGAWQNTASPEELITKLEQAIDDVTSKKRIVQAEPGGPLMIGANGPELHNDAIKKLKLSKLQADEINRIVQSHHREYLALERRHSKITKDDKGRILTTIAPFTDECQALAKRLVAELGGIVEFAILPEPRVGQLPTQIFRSGGELPQTITMWQADGKYFVEDKRGSYTFNMSGPNLQDLPQQYRLFWRED